MLRLFAHPVASYWMLLRVVWQSLKPALLARTNIFGKQVPTFLGVIASDCLSFTWGE